MTRAARAIEIGKQNVGVIAYKLGAKCPPGQTLDDCEELDCSGFIRELLREVGVVIPDGSQQQKATCRPVPLELALGPQGAGCLLFMSPPPGAPWPRHVGISLGGLSLECCSFGRSVDGKRVSGVCICKRDNWGSAGKLNALFTEAE